MSEKDKPHSLPQVAYTITEAVKVSAIKKDGIYYAINNGLLVGKKFGNRTLILHSDLVKFLNALPDYVPGTEERPKLPRKPK